MNGNEISLVGGPVYMSSRPVGRYGGRYVRRGGVNSTPLRYNTFTNTRWGRIQSDRSLLQEAVQAPQRPNTRESYVPQRATQPSETAVCSASSKHNGECGKVISRILSKFSNDLTSPGVFGPPAWFTYHNGTAHLPENLSATEQRELYGFVQGIPLMTPCSVCQPHARSYIQQHDAELREAIKTRDGAFAWFVDFHNFVNHRTGKRELTIDEARMLYRVDNQCPVTE